MKGAQILAGFFDQLAGLSVEHARRTAQRRKEARRPRRGSTLRPGDDTPLWLAVVEKMRPHLRVRGAKAGLGRVLEMPRQRVHDYFVSGTQMPDAERLIRILLWLAAHEADGAINKSPDPLR